MSKSLYYHSNKTYPSCLYLLLLLLISLTYNAAPNCPMGIGTYNKDTNSVDVIASSSYVTYYNVSDSTTYYVAYMDANTTCAILTNGTYDYNNTAATCGSDGDRCISITLSTFPQISLYTCSSGINLGLNNFASSTTSDTSTFWLSPDSNTPSDTDCASAAVSGVDYTPFNAVVSYNICDGDDCNGDSSDFNRYYNRNCYPCEEYECIMDEKLYRLGEDQTEFETCIASSNTSGWNPDWTCDSHVACRFNSKGKSVCSCQPLDELFTQRDLYMEYGLYGLAGLIAFTFANCGLCWCFGCCWYSTKLSDIVEEEE